MPCGPRTLDANVAAWLRTWREAGVHQSGSGINCAIMNKPLSQPMMMLLTPLLVLALHAITFFPHEYGHSFMAWLGGFKSNPFIIDFGDTSWQNLLLQLKMDEYVDYRPIIAGNHHFWVALIAFAGIGMNIVLLGFSWPKLAKKKALITLYDYCLYWFVWWNLCHIYAYVPIRTFTTHADMNYIWTALSISPWWIMAVIGLPTFYLIGYFLVKFMPKQPWMIVSTILVLFGYCASAPAMGNYGEISEFLMHLSWLSIPLLVMVFSVGSFKNKA